MGFRRRHRSRGQSLAEFALVFPVFIAIVGAIVQFGMVFWAQNTLTQVVRDTGRWAATQQTCGTNLSLLAQQADQIAANASLWGHTSTEFQTQNPALAAGTTDASVNTFNQPNAMAASWVQDYDPATGTVLPDGSTWTHEGCAPKDNQAVYHVIIRINQTVPTFFPGMQYLPALGTCDANGCRITLSSTAQFRMEPLP